MHIAPNRAGFSYIELLIVVSLIAVLVALLLPAVQQAREAARRTSCKNNLRQIGLALHGYEAAHRVLPPGWMASRPEIGPDLSTGGNGFAWAAMILPHLDEGPLYRKLDFQSDLWAPVQAPWIARPVSVLQCSSDGGEPVAWTMPLGPNQSVTLGRSNYLGNFGTASPSTCYSIPGGTACTSDGPFFQNSSIAFDEITDGLSSTVLIGEQVNVIRESTWSGVYSSGMQPIERVVGAADPTKGGFGDFSSRHLGGGHFALADGSVSFMSENLSPGDFAQLSTIDGEEPPIDF